MGPKLFCEALLVALDLEVGEKREKGVRKGKIVKKKLQIIFV